MRSAAERLRRVEACVRHGRECHEGVARKGEFQPCDKPAIALRDSREDDAYYPVCAYHARGFCLPLVDPDDAAALVAAIRAVQQIAFDPDIVSALEHGVVRDGPGTGVGISTAEALNYAVEALRDIRNAITEALA